MSKTELKVRPSKIIAGLEPKETNILLQTIAKCIDKKVDTKNYVAQLHSAPKDKAATKKPSTRKPQREASVTRSNLKSKSDTTPKSDRSHNNKTKEKKSKKTVKEEEPPHESETKEVTEEVVTTDATKEEVVVDDVVDTPKKVEVQDVSGFSNARQSSAGLVRPKSARPKSGELKTASTSGNLCFFANVVKQTSFFSVHVETTERAPVQC